MNAGIWGIVIGVVVTVGLSLGSWMFMVHAKLAEIAAQLAGLVEKIGGATQSNQQLWACHTDHEARIAVLEAQQEE